MGDKYVKNVADSYGQAQQSGSGVNPATRDAFDRITQQPAPHYPPLVDPALNAAIMNKNELVKQNASQVPPKSTGVLEDAAGGIMGSSGAAMVGALVGKKFGGPWGVAAGAVAGPLVKAAWDHRDELMPPIPPLDNDVPQTPMPPHNTEMPGTEMKPRHYPEFSEY